MAFDPFVGRDELLGHLVEACTRTPGSGRSTTILLTGDAGIGKSRLGREVAGRARQEGFVVAETRCWAHGGAPPLWPWRELLRHLEPSGGSRPSGGARVTLSNWPGMETGFGVFEASLDRLRLVAEQTPVLAVIDDLHEADEGTLLLTRFLAAQLGDAPVVLLATVRSGAVASTSREAELLDDLQRSSTTIEVTGLGLASLGALAELAGRPASAAALDTLFAITKGNPLVAQSVLRAAPEGPLDTSLPAGVGDAVTRRLAGIDPAVRRTLAVAAILGTEVAVDEVVAVSGSGAAAVAAAGAVGVQVQILASASAASWVFTHDLVRAAVEDELTPEERDAAHAAAVGVVDRADPTGDGPLRAVRHALACARRSPADQHRAVALARSAAANLVARDAHGDAASLLGDAVRTVEAAGLDAPAPLLVDQAHAVLASGRLVEAHRLFVAATDAADVQGDPVLRAEAAAGLGGIWINNVRSSVEQARILRLQRDALAGLPPGHDGLALRLRSRIASGAVFWEGRPVEPLLALAAEARELGDASVVLEVLSNVHPALLGPQWNGTRLELSAQMIRAAGRVPGGIYALMARCWRAVDLFLTGDPGALAALDALRGPAEALQSISVLFIVRLMEAMLAIRAGRLAEAEQLCEDAFKLGLRCEDTDAAAYYGVQLLAIRWLQGRDAETLAQFEELAGSENVIPGDQAFNAAVAALAARVGADDVARRHLGSVLDGAGLRGLPRFSTWLATMTAVVETAAALGDVDVASSALDQLEPFADLPVMPSLAVVCFGSTHLPLGLAAATVGRLDLAVEHLEAAVAANVRLGNLPRAAVARHELAVALERRGGPDDLVAARRWHAAAMDAAGRLELDGLVASWGAASRRGADGSSPALTLTAADSTWVIEFGGERLVLPDRIGLRYLAQLVANPDRDVPATVLATGTAGRGSSGPSDRQAVLDPQAREAYERRARELAGAIADARAAADAVTQAALEDELDAVAGELRKATGLANRDRHFGNDAERARTAVRKAVVRAIADIAAGLPSAGEHLRASITTGAVCRYAPPSID